MLQMILNYFVITFIGYNLVRRLWKCLDRYGKKIQLIGNIILALVVILVVFFIGTEYATDILLIMQFFVFLSDAYKGEFYKTTQKNFYDLTYNEKFFLITYNLFFVSFYFIYVAYSFLNNLSYQMLPVGFLILIMVFIYLNVTNRRKGGSGHFFHGNIKNQMNS